MRVYLSLITILALLAGSVASAQTAATNGNSMNLKPAEPIGGRVTEKSETTTTTTEGCCEKNCGVAGEYREISDFFNIREANPNTEKGEWELEQEAAWETNSDGTDDDFFTATTLKYGVTDDFFVELELLPLNLGDGDDQGNGDLGIQLFQRFVKETDVLPSIAGWAEMRIPSGEGSEGVDGEFHLNFTKIVACNLRAHFEGWVETANGGRGDEDINRRHFQWGLGPGFDYSFNPETIATLNYLMRSSEEYGHHNSNILEVGLARQLAPHWWFKTAVDVGLDGQEESPNFATKFLIEYEFGGSSCN